MIVTGPEVDRAEIEAILTLMLQCMHVLSLREWARSIRIVVVRLEEFREVATDVVAKWAEEGAEVVRDSLHLFQHPVHYLAQVQDSAIARTRL